MSDSPGVGIEGGAFEGRIRVLIIDDQPILRRGFRTVLELDGGFDVVGEAGSGRTAIALAAEVDPDVVLMDIRMPDGDGIEATSRILAHRPETRVLVLTTFDLDEYAFEALRAGAGGFLLKDVRPADLIAAVRAVADGEAVLSPRITRRMLDLFGDRLPSVAASASDPLEILTVREREVLVLMARGLSNGEIATELFLSMATIKTHVGRVLAKLELRDRVHATILAYELGLVDVRS